VNAASQSGPSVTALDLRGCSSPTPPGRARPRPTGRSCPAAPGQRWHRPRATPPARRRAARPPPAAGTRHRPRRPGPWQGRPQILTADAHRQLSEEDLQAVALGRGADLPEVGEAQPGACWSGTSPRQPPKSADWSTKLATCTCPLSLESATAGRPGSLGGATKTSSLKPASNRYRALTSGLVTRRAAWRGGKRSFRLRRFRRPIRSIHGPGEVLGASVRGLFPRGRRQDQRGGPRVLVACPDPTAGNLRARDLLSTVRSVQTDPAG
jgi:hypothetical protein